MLPNHTVQEVVTMILIAKGVEDNQRMPIALQVRSRFRFITIVMQVQDLMLRVGLMSI